MSWNTAWILQNAHISVQPHGFSHSEHVCTSNKTQFNGMNFTNIPVEARLTLPCFPPHQCLSFPLGVTTNQISNAENWFAILGAT